jgi:putative ABC transport system permease protein
MKMHERFLYSVRNLTHRKLRTALTILGIIVGITSIIILISLAGGLKEDVVSRLANFDPDLILILPTQISPGDFSSVVRQGKLYEKDYNSIRQIPGVDIMSKTISKRVALEFKDELVSATVYAIEPTIYRETTTLIIQNGRFLQDGDRDVVVFGGGIAELFDEDVQVNSIVELDNRKYRVVGILEKTGNTFSNLDNIVYLDYNEGKRIFSDFILPNEISAIQVKVAEGYDVVEVSDRIEEVLMRNHKVSEDEKDFGILTAVSLNEQINSIIEIISIFLSAVATISIIVGMIGISNTMFMSVMERTKEVGVLKAIGSSSKEIIYIFTIEAGILGLLGGILGLLFALIFNFTLGLFGVTTAMSIELLLGSVVFAFGIGVLAGVLPAKRASEIPAIEALRYE